MTAQATTAASLLLDELQTALHQGSLSRRVETLRRVTDLFVGQSADYSDEQIAVFDDVFNCLVERIEISARVRLSERLAKHPMSPPRIVRKLAFDDLIDVAAPMLSHSDRLDEASLIENAISKSHAHLLAITMRKTLGEKVTDVLVARGDDAVVESVARNPGAAFSETGYDQLISRTQASEAIALAVGLRKNIPRPHYLKLIARASRAVRDRLEAARAAPDEDIAFAVDSAAGDVKTGVKNDAAFLAAQRLIRSLRADDRLDEDQVLTFVRAGKFDETACALASLADIPAEAAETVLSGSRSEGILVMAKVAGLSWAAVVAILEMSGVDARTSTGTGEVEISQESYERLRTTTAQQVLRFYKMQASAAVVPQIA